MTEKQKALMCVQTYGFAVDEAVLFLDTHPDDKAALDYYHKAVNEYKMAVKNYTDAFGPLNVTQNMSRDAWQWTDGCMPWEVDCNVEI